MSTHDLINEILVNLFHQIWELEERGIISEEFADISNNDMHIIEAIGLDANNNMSVIAKKMNITVSSLTIAMNALVRKNYVMRIRSDEDRRVVYIALTEKGEKAFHHHAAFHKKMVKAVAAHLTDEELDVLEDMLVKLSGFFAGYQ